MLEVEHFCMKARGMHKDHAVTALPEYFNQADTFETNSRSVALTKHPLRRSIITKRRFEADSLRALYKSS